MSSAVITAKIGTANTVTAATYTGLKSFEFDLVAQTLELVCDVGRPIFDIKADTTFTLVLTTGNYVLTVS